jgi:hypothetical protein
MKYFWSRLVPVLLPACMVDTPVVEGDPVEGDRLGADLAAWCDSRCARAAECDPEEYPDECPDRCFTYYGEMFAGKTDACTEAGLRLMDCEENLTCAEVRSRDACPQADEEDRCLRSRGLAACRADESGSGGSAGFGGSGTPPVPESCSMGVSDCSDDRTYAIACEGFGDTPVCECTTDGYVTGRFAPNENSCPESFTAKQICGWPVVVHRGEPSIPPLVSCEVYGGDGAAGGGNVAQCGAQFGVCSDGRSYGVDCDGSPGLVTCTCFIDDEAVGYHESAAGICPFIWDPDGGAVAANHACGFRIAPTIEQ